ncbi:MAG: hypothetical protein II238_01260 [Alphaproteobacteria bacterium]|nr:hypothetical protein [Alphaproteobacteria bacterium]
MAQLNKMKRPQLVQWIQNLERSIKTCNDEHNRQLFTKWYNEAVNELHARDERCANYCKWKGIN